MRFIRPRDVMEMISVSRATLWRMVRAGTFPQPVRITARKRGFLLEAVEAWMKARTDATAIDSGPAPGGRQRRPRRAATSALFPGGVHGPAR
jgi:prophage regulatory protein